MAVARIYRMSCARGRREELRGALEALAGARAFARVMPALADKPSCGSFEHVLKI